MTYTNIIYGLIDPFTQQLRYIGQTTWGMVRARAHWRKSELRKNANPHKCNWLRSILHRGAEPEIVVLEEFESSLDLNEAEQWNIAYYRSIGCNLLNAANGSTVGWRHSPQSKAAIGKANTGRKPSSSSIENSVKARAGKPLSKEHKAKIRTASGRPRGPYPEDRVRNIRKAFGARPFVDQNGVRYESQGQAAKTLGIGQGEISAVLNGHRKYARGFTFTYLTE